ncbi:MAG: CAP domain-containing protein [Cypionkella sp.]
MSYLKSALRAGLIVLLGASPAFANDMQTEALAIINAQRAQVGCGALKLHPALQKAAAGHASAMAAQNFFSHTGKNGSKLKGRINAAGYKWRAIAENIAAGQTSAAQVVSVWMQSAGHRQNMLNCAYSETGLAVVHQPDDQPIKGNSYPFYYYWVQTFGSP